MSPALPPPTPPGYQELVKRLDELDSHVPAIYRAEGERIRDMAKVAHLSADFAELRVGLYSMGDQVRQRAEGIEKKQASLESESFRQSQTLDQVHHRLIAIEKLLGVLVEQGRSRA